ncbi:hypothetical protein RVR_8260 [Actinacidiphila reveromycinica]|uniref:Uncharacterized protein n=1 Tax=Actinacidiphila reveromycinica TaxID=659352 RepID=A0A7U3UY52_9ACTN|nr:hypothetical protein [Streptomyces sp. SN-593]BBB01028.1 hypothetical protein RVR_8260 [Streptomyces sp. SN-593]
MTTPLPGMPTPPAPSADYETWAETVRPVYAAAASTGRTFLCWHIARDHHLPDPPNPKRDWARLMSDLHRAGLIRQDGYGEARDHSAVHAWRGTRAAMQGRAA